MPLITLGTETREREIPHRISSPVPVDRNLPPRFRGHLKGFWWQGEAFPNCQCLGEPSPEKHCSPRRKWHSGALCSELEWSRKDGTNAHSLRASVEAALCQMLTHNSWHPHHRSNQPGLLWMIIALSPTPACLFSGWTYSEAASLPCVSSPREAKDSPLSVSWFQP